MTELTKILYAEDELDIQIIVELAVQSTSNYDIKICNNGKELLNCVEEVRPDLILLDVMMPEMDGPTTFKNLQAKEKTKNIPVIFMTAKAQAHELEIYKSSGVIGIITKPFDPMDLCSNIKKIWSEHSGTDSLSLKINELKTGYLKKMETILSDLKLIISENKIDIDELYMRVHTISGTSGMYGLGDLSSVSTEFEIYLKTLKENANSDTKDLITKLSDYTVYIEKLVIAGA